MVRPVLPTPEPSDRKVEPSNETHSNAQAPTQDPAGGVARNGLATSAERAPHGETGPSRSAPLPTEYRGKSSGEFQRVAPGSAPDANALIAEAERYLLTLSPTNRNRRLLEVAILRRDTALLGGLLEVFRRGGR